MKNAVGIRLRHAGDIAYVDPKGNDLHIQEKVIVEVDGNDYSGVVVLENREMDDEKLPEYTGVFKRVMSVKDANQLEQLYAKETDCEKICKQLIEKNGLDMKLVNCECSFDGKKILFNFTADDRVDFRNLVKDLAAKFHARIELRQIGVRDEAKILGGLGFCGRPLCCGTYLNEFAPTSIKMAKDQNLSLNPTKISGICGRLMCCLNHEEETYLYLNKDMPFVGDTVKTPEGEEGIISSTNILRQTAKVIVELPGDEKELREYNAHKLKILKRKKKQAQNAEPKN